MQLYFAYGSNLSKTRLMERVGVIESEVGRSDHVMMMMMNHHHDHHDHDGGMEGS